MLPPGALSLSLQNGGSVVVASRPDGTFRIENVGDGSRTVSKVNRSELAALHAAISEMLKFYATNV